MEKKLIHNWLFWLPVFVSFGILIYFNLPSEPTVNYMFAAGLIPGLYLLSRKHKLAAIYATALLLGFAACIVRTSWVQTPVLPYKVEDTWIKGKIEEIQYSAIGARLTVSNLWVKNLPRESTPLKVKITVRTKIETVAVGDVVVFKGTLMPPPGPSMPDGFDYQRFAYYQQVGGIGYATSRIKVKYSAPISSHFIEKIRQNAISRINTILPQPAASIASGMLVGDTSYLKQKIYEPVKIAGIAHVIAISGMHMVVVVSIIFLAARWLCGLSQYLTLHFNTKKIAALLAISGSLFYLLLAGNPVSAQRAYIMSSMVLLAIIVDRNNQPLHSLAVACTLLLLVTPESLLNPSLQMSVAACFGLICSYRFLQRWIPPKEGQNWLNTALHYGINIASSTLVAGMFTAPFIIYHFHQFSTYSVLANLISIPLTDFILMPLGMLGLLLMPVSLDKFIFIAMEYGINFMLWIATSIASLPNASLFVPSVPGYAMTLFSYGAIIAFIGSGRLRAMGYVMISASLLNILWIKMPDVIIDSHGKLFSVRYNGKYYFSDKRSNRFVRKIWQESLGENETLTIKEANISDCSVDRCVVNTKSTTLITKHPEQSNCDKYKVIVDLSDAPVNCEKSRVITLKNLSEEGTHLLWLDEEDVTIKKSFAQNNRPWTR